MSVPKIQIFAGHYGSGKTNLSVNTAFALKKENYAVTLCDLDIVNPYFRTKDSASKLEQAGIRLISPKYANSGVDLPVVPAEANAIFNGDDRVIIDVGGDDSGAVALGQFADRVRNAGYEMYLVINKYRFLTREPEDALQMKREIETATQLVFTGIVNNSNLGSETTGETVMKSLPYAEAVSALTGLPVVFHSVVADLAEGLNGRVPRLLPIHIYGKDVWKI